MHNIPTMAVIQSFITIGAVMLLWSLHARLSRPGVQMVGVGVDVVRAVPRGRRARALVLGRLDGAKVTLTALASMLGFLLLRHFSCSARFALSSAPADAARIARRAHHLRFFGVVSCSFPGHGPTSTRATTFASRRVHWLSRAPFFIARGSSSRGGAGSVHAPACLRGVSLYGSAQTLYGLRSWLGSPGVRAMLGSAVETFIGWRLSSSESISPTSTARASVSCSSSSRRLPAFAESPPGKASAGGAGDGRKSRAAGGNRGPPAGRARAATVGGEVRRRVSLEPLRHGHHALRAGHDRRRQRGSWYAAVRLHPRRAPRQQLERARVSGSIRTSART